MKTNSEFPTQFVELNAILGQLTRGVQAVLGLNLVGVYLQGSFACGDADEHSDVDFLVVIGQPLSEADRQAAMEKLKRKQQDLESGTASMSASSACMRAASGTASLTRPS